MCGYKNNRFIILCRQSIAYAFLSEMYIAI